MNLGTFGAVLKYAIQLESTAADFYKVITTVIKDSELTNLFETSKTQSQKHIAIIKRVRRENTTEMILEPIFDLESETFQLPDFSEASDPFDIAKTIEKTLYDFYLKASEKIGFLSEVAYTFEQLADGHLKNLKILKEKE